MISGKVMIRNPIGLHLRPAALLSQNALMFQAHITFHVRNVTANAKSVLSILGACVRHGEEIELVCEGEDEQVAYDTIMALIESGLGDELEN